MNAPVGKVMTTLRLRQWDGHHFHRRKKDEEEEASCRREPRGGEHRLPPPTPVPPGPWGCSASQKSQLSLHVAAEMTVRTRPGGGARFGLKRPPQNGDFSPLSRTLVSPIFAKLLSTLQSVARTRLPLLSSPLPLLQAALLLSSCANYQGYGR